MTTTTTYVLDAHSFDYAHRLLANAWQGHHSQPLMAPVLAYVEGAADYAVDSDRAWPTRGPDVPVEIARYGLRLSE